MKTYTLPLELTEYQFMVLSELLRNDARRSEREGTTDSPFATAVREIDWQITKHLQAVSERKANDNGN